MPEDKFQIIIRSYELADYPVLAPVVHHEIIFAQNGNPLISFNGYAHNRETGKTLFPSTSGQDTLRVDVINNTMHEDNKEANYPIAAEAVLFEGNLEEMFAKLGQAIEVGKFINAQNMDYVILGGPTFPGQNSNSVAYTLTQAMELEVPPEVENLWAPGYGRLLLPNNWQSNLPTSPEGLHSYVQNNMPDLEFRNVAGQVIADGNPYRNYMPGQSDEAIRPGRFFDPDNPVIPQAEMKAGPLPEATPKPP